MFSYYFSVFTAVVVSSFFIRRTESVIASNVSSSRAISQASSSYTPTAVSNRLSHSSSSTGTGSSQPPQSQSGLQAALACWAQWDEYSTSSTECPKTTITEPPVTWTSNMISIIEETFSLCDGYPRAVATGGEHTWTSLGEMSGTPYTTYTAVLPPSGIPLSTEKTLVTTTTTYMEISCASTIPTPKCSVGNDDCKALFSFWTAGGFTKLRPPCAYALPTNPCDNCYIYIPSVRLIYFPVSMTGNFCGNYTTVIPTSPPDVTTPTTVQVHGTTFTSGFAYLSYAGVTATGPDGNCGTTITAGILPLPSSEVFSYRGHAAAMAIAGDIQYPFNFADLAPNPVPWAAWISQETCFTQQAYPQCQTITQAAYRPGIVYPSAFWSLNSQWSNCVSGIFGILDPPTALPTANAAVSPTYATRSVVSTTTATPKQDPTQSIVRATSNSVDTSPKASHDPTVRTSETLDQPTGITSKTGIPTTVLRTSRFSIGTLAIHPASRHGVVSIGTDLLSDGQATTIGRTVVSLDSNSLVFGLVESTSTAFSNPLNAVSVLAAAHTQGQPSAVFTVDGEAYTAYPGGMIAGESTTMYVAHHTAVDVAGHTVSMGDGMIWVDSSSIAFEKSRRKNSHSSTDGSKTEEMIVTTVKHGSSRTTLLGYVDSAGNTIMKFGTKVLTCTGDIIGRDGMTYTIVGVSCGPTEQTSLPKIVSTGVSITGTLPATQRPTANTGAGPSTSTAKSASTASITALDIAVPVIIFTMSLLQWF